MTDDAKTKMLKTNEEQARFYDAPSAARVGNIPMKIWRTFRRRLYLLMRNGGMWNDVFSRHKAWMGDLSDKRVLDLGCYEGNALSFYLAENSRSYLGIDLSQQAIGRLADGFRKRGIEGAEVKCVDALSDEFYDTGFDIVYAQGVLHHFKPISEILAVLHSKLNPGGRIVSFDPIQTSVLTRSARALYHPFRSDKEWEWPFRKETFPEIKKYFRIIEVQGVMGSSKWAMPLAFLNEKFATRVFKSLHAKDIANATSESSHLWACMQVAMCMEKRELDANRGTGHGDRTSV